MSNVRKYLLFLAAALGAVLFFALNIITPLYMDDYSYMFDFVTKERIDSLPDIFRSMGIHYMKVNGRYVTHFLAQMLLAFGKGIFDLLNTAVFVWLVYIMHKLSGCRGKLIPLLTTVGIAGLWFCSPNFGQSFLWVTGAANYLWGVAVILSFLFVFRYPELMPKMPKILCCISFFVLGLLAGNCTENAFAALLIAVVDILIVYRLDKKIVPVWSYFGLLGLLSGGACMIFSPGELVRISSSGGGFDVSLLLARAVDIAVRYIDAYLPILCSGAIVLLVAVCKKRIKLCDCAMPLVYFCASLAGAFSLVLSPASPDRAWSCVTVLAVLSLQSLLFVVLKDVKLNMVTNVCTVLLIFVLVFSYCIAYAELISVRADFEERDMIAQEQIARGEDELDLPAVSSQSKYSPFEAWGDLDDDSGDWKNVAMARYYGVKRVIKK